MKLLDAVPNCTNALVVTIFITILANCLKINLELALYSFIERLCKSERFFSRSYRIISLLLRKP